MQYKTIIHQLLQQQYPALQEQLRVTRTLLAALGRYAITLKARHDYWTTEFRQANPDREAIQIASIALERALDDIQDALRCDWPPSPPGADLSVRAMAPMANNSPRVWGCRDRSNRSISTGACHRPAVLVKGL